MTEDTKRQKGHAEVDLVVYYGRQANARTGVAHHWTKDTELMLVFAFIRKTDAICNIQVL